MEASSSSPPPTPVGWMADMLFSVSILIQGKVISGMDVVKKIEGFGSSSG